MAPAQSVSSCCKSLPLPRVSPVYFECRDTRKKLAENKAKKIAAQQDKAKKKATADAKKKAAKRAKKKSKSEEDDEEDEDDEADEPEEEQESSDESEKSENIDDNEQEPDPVIIEDMNPGERLARGPMTKGSINGCVFTKDMQLDIDEENTSAYLAIHVAFM